ncbi:MAG TPA: putative metal-dependent hydrolase [Acidobacteriaceae bacterium]|jgi:hypothetical protein
MAKALVSQEIDPMYPVGKFQRPEKITPQKRIAAIAAIAAMPHQLGEALEGLGRDQLDTPYRDGGWTVRQLVHHIADSHMNAFVRVRLALTEDWPTISPYDEKAWALLPDAAGPVGWSLALLENLHTRWVMMLDALAEEQWARGVNHPENGRMSVELSTLLYGWHCRHHVAHIVRLREKERW